MKPRNLADKYMRQGETGWKRQSHVHQKKIAKYIKDPTMECWFDGSNKLASICWSFVVKRGTETVKTFYDVLREPKLSSNYSEYMGLNALLRWLIQEGLNREPIVIYGDSKLVIKQCRGEFGAKDGLYVPLYNEAQELIKQFPSVMFSWIPREQNHVADKLTKNH